MREFGSTSAYLAMLKANFRAYSSARFMHREYLFLERPKSEAVVFRGEHITANLLIPPDVSVDDQRRIIELIPTSQRHVHFGSMQSSQALVQSVFGAITVLNKQPLLSHIMADDGRRAFGSKPNEATIEFEKPVRTLGEPRSTSIDVWLKGPYSVAVECKLAEAHFGTCSRPRLSPMNSAHALKHCDGTHTFQRGRSSRCALTEIGVRYWDYTKDLLGWSADTDHRPCPLASSYQLVRNILAACVDDSGIMNVERGHALIIYDERNPAMGAGGEGDRQWNSTVKALRIPGLLRRVSWQAFVAQWPRDKVLDWMKEELRAKYGLIPSGVSTPPC